jgi:hypothetical protein
MTINAAAIAAIFHFELLIEASLPARDGRFESGTNDEMPIAKAT